MGSKYKVVITDHRFPNVDIQREVLARIGAELIEGQAKTEEEIIAIAKDADGILNARSKITEKVINALTSCKIMVRYGVGVDTIDIAAATRKGIMVSNVLDYCVDEVSDHALAIVDNENHCMSVLLRHFPMINRLSVDRWINRYILV